MSTTRPSLRRVRRRTDCCRYVREEFEAYLTCDRMEYGFLRLRGAADGRQRGTVGGGGTAVQAAASVGVVVAICAAVSARDQPAASNPGPWDCLSDDLGRSAARGRTHAQHGRYGCRDLDPAVGSALNLNIHLHVLFLDGVYVRAAVGEGEAAKPVFQRVAAPSSAARRRAHRARARAARLLVRDCEQSYLALDPGKGEPVG